MNTLAEKVFMGTWRSYKIFLRSGNVKQHTLDSFLEFSINEERVLTITEYSDRKQRKLAQTDQWAIEFNNKNYYLCCKLPSFSYEVITVNHTALVLLDNANEEKIFFTRETFWEMHLQKNTSPVL